MSNRTHRVDRREFILSAGRSALGVAGAVSLLPESLARALAPPAKAPRPNFVFFLIDDMGWADVAYNGSKFYRTPHIDKLASEGMVFTDAYAACPLCSPTRASILTGKNPARLHMHSAITANTKTYRAEDKGTERPFWKVVGPGSLTHLPLEEVTIAEELKKAGYTTGFFGKWHLDAHKAKGKYTPDKQGFDTNIGGGFYPSPRSYFSPYKMADVIVDGPAGEYMTDRLTDEAVKFLDANRSKPFLLYLSHYAVHTPLQAKKDLVAEYDKTADPEAPQHNSTYAAMIHSVDESVGRVLKKLDDLGLAEDTVVIFMSDNGGLTRLPGSKPKRPNAGQHVTSNSPLRGGKAMIYEGGIREPMIFRYPRRVRPGSRCATPVISDDFYPTMLALAGLKPSAGKVLDGKNLTGLLTGTGPLERDAICWHFPQYIAGYREEWSKQTFWNTPSSAIRMGDWKLIEFYEGRLELYNLTDDIGETTNLADKHPDRVRAMRARLRKWLKECDAWMPIPNPKYDPNAKPPKQPGQRRRRRRAGT